MIEKWRTNCMPDGIKKNIRAVIEGTDELAKKNITLSLSVETIEQLDKLSKKMTELNGSKTISRNFIIESAIQTYLEEAKMLLVEDYNINLDDVVIEEEISQGKTVFDFDTVIFPGYNEGFEEAFIGEDCWYPVRIQDKKIPLLSYVAVYRAAPFSGISHVAKIKRIEQYQNSSKKIIYFDGKAKKLDTPVMLGESEAASMRSPRYTTLSRLLNAREVKELF